MTSVKKTTSHGRLKAEGFPLAPLIEAVFAVQFEGGLSDAEIEDSVKGLARWYPRTTKSSYREFLLDPAADVIDIKEPRPSFRMEADDETQILLVRPDGISISQLAPYMSWDVLFDRTKRDIINIWSQIERPITRMATRYINRIDVPFNGDVARYEDYLEAHVHLPETIKAVQGFELRFILETPEISGIAVVESTVMPQAIEGCAAFSLDIDLSRTREIPQGHEEFFELFQQFRDVKNRLYRTFLTPKALEQFR